MGVKGVGRLLISFLALAAAGCSTVIKTASDGSDEASGERAALVDAAAAAAWAPWAKPSSSTLADRLAGAEAAGDQVSRDDAVNQYVSLLSQSTDGKAALMRDAKRHLDAAKRLEEIADDAADLPRPRLSDVALVEDAIADLRETRTIYLASLKRIDGDKKLTEQLKRGFDEALKDLGKAADHLADYAMKGRAEAYSGAAKISSGAGSF